MNNLASITQVAMKRDLIDRALSELGQSFDAHGKVLATNDAPWDARVLLEVGGQKLTYHCEVKGRIDRRSVLLDLKARGLAVPDGLLVTTLLSQELAATCRELGLQFIDTAGNAYLNNGAGLYVFVSGRRTSELGLNTVEVATITPAALRVMFGFLADPSMLNAPYREIAPAVRISTGAIGKVFDTLHARGFIATTPNGDRVIVAPDLLLGEWATGYLSRLKPKLKTYRFSGPSVQEFSERWAPAYRESAWGGETGAAIHTKHLKPGACTVYLQMDETQALRNLVKDFKLKADPAGPIEVVEAFWNMDWFADAFPTVPLPLIYADLLGTHDARNLAVAKHIASEVTNHVRR